MKNDSVRALIDNAISDVLEIPALDMLRESLAREPMISGKQL